MKNRMRQSIPVSAELKPYVEFDSFDRYVRRKNRITAIALAVVATGALMKNDMMEPVTITTAVAAVPYLMIRRQNTLENMELLKPQNTLDRLGNPSDISILRERVNRALESAASSLMPLNLSLAAGVLMEENSISENGLSLVLNGGFGLVGAVVDMSMRANLRSQLPTSDD